MSEQLIPVAAQLTLGAALGFCVGYLLKKVGKLVAIIVGFTFGLLQVLAYAEVITINWDADRGVVGPGAPAGTPRAPVAGGARGAVRQRARAGRRCSRSRPGAQEGLTARVYGCERQLRVPLPGAPHEDRRILQPFLGADAAVVGQPGDVGGPAQRAEGA